MLVTDTNLPSERERIRQLIAMVPAGLSSALDVGAADCHIAGLLADTLPSVTAVDVEEPQTADSRICTAQGDVTALAFADNAFDMVVCSQVIEHIEPALLQKACDELSRVAGRFVLIAVPYRQDVRVGRMTCAACGGRNHPYGHRSSFDEEKLQALFRPLVPVRSALIGPAHRNVTNALSAWLMDFAGNPYGTYEQQQPCMVCGQRLSRPKGRSLMQKVATRLACHLNRVQAAFVAPRASFVQMLFQKDR